MRGGRRADTLEDKQARGTFRPDRDAHKMPTLVVDNNGPIMPVFMLGNDPETDGLAIIARSIWADLHPKVTALGVGESDSNLFARYCMLEAHVRVMLAAGHMPNMDKMTQLRQMEELLRIAGPKSRVATKADNARNPFLKNGNKRGK